MRAALLVIAVVAVLAVMLSLTRGPVVVSGSPTAPAVTPVAAPRVGVAAPATNMATPTFGKPRVITPVSTTRPPASATPIAGSKGE